MGRARSPVRAGWAVVLGFALGCSDGQVDPSYHPLEGVASAERVVLYSIDIERFLRPEIVERFQGYPVLGKLDITEPVERRAVVDAVEDGIRRCRQTIGSNCFWPRHGIRVTRGEEVTDYVICFECDQIEVYDGKGSQVEYFLTTEDPKSILDKRLTAAGVTLAPAGSAR